MILLLKTLVICSFIKYLEACSSQIDCKSGTIKFFLFGSQEKEVYELLFDEDNIKAAPLARNEKIKILILHDKYDSDASQVFKSEYMKAPTVSVIFVDYSKLSAKLEEIGQKIFPCLEHIARCISSILRAILLIKVDIQLPQFHLIAFGPAANIPAYVAEQLKLGNFDKLDRISILEPITYPDFSYINQKTNVHSARFVDVYHTNGGGMAARSSSAHLEVHFNDGRHQPTCAGEKVDECSHKMVLRYFAESINSDSGFFGAKCLHPFENTCELFSPPVLKLVGDHAYADDICLAFVKEVFAVRTNENEPFARGPHQKTEN